MLSHRIIDVGGIVGRLLAYFPDCRQPLLNKRSGEVEWRWYRYVLERAGASFWYAAHVPIDDLPVPHRLAVPSGSGGQLAGLARAACDRRLRRAQPTP